MPTSISTETYGELLALQETLNAKLKTAFEENSHRTREELATVLVQTVETMVDELNSDGYCFGPASYGGSTEFEQSEQDFSDGDEMGTGVILSFAGFSVQVTWASP